MEWPWGIGATIQVAWMTFSTTCKTLWTLMKTLSWTTAFHMEVTTVAPVYRNVRGRRNRGKKNKAAHKGITEFLATNLPLSRLTTRTTCVPLVPLSPAKAALDYPANHPMRDKLTKADVPFQTRRSVKPPSPSAKPRGLIPSAPAVRTNSPRSKLCYLITRS